MNKLLIHNNNTSFNRIDLFQISEQFVFDVDFDKDVDFYINENLAAGDLKNKLEKADLIFIKISLSQNYLEYLGLRVAYHIRLTNLLGAKANVPIIFIAEESLQFIGLTYSEPSILFTKGIYLIKETIKEYRNILKWYDAGTIRPLNNFNEFINTINVNPPANYQSHHSIANEWSILRWAKVLGIPLNNKLLEVVKNNIESLLYYKYLQSKYPAQNEPDKALFKIKGKGKVLYIDDEWSKGWNIVFNEFIGISPELKNEFEIFEYDFKDKKEEVIINDCKIKIETFDPAIIILDLRLFDGDFENDKGPNNLSGYKLLKVVKEINPGIRVIIFTASNKVWNLIELQNAGADGFVLKETPEFEFDKNITKNTIEKFAFTIQDQLKYQFQKHLFTKLKEIKSNIQIEEIEENEEYNKLIKGLKKQLSVIRASVEKINLNRNVTLDIVYLSCYNFLELFKDYYIKEAKDYRYYIGFNEIQLNRYKISYSPNVVHNDGEFIKINSNDHPSWFNSIASLFIDYFKISTHPFAEIFKLKRVAEKRNDYIHGDKLSFDYNELILIIDLLETATKAMKE